MRIIAARSLNRAQSLVESCVPCTALSHLPWPADRAIRPGFQRRYRNTKADDTQKIPLDGYYADILSRPSNTTSDSKRSTPAPASATPAPKTSTTPIQPNASDLPTPSTPAATAQAEEEDREARARIVFGTRLAGPERRRELDKGATYIAGVKIPAKPEEPDNCCMSGCVNCVWDLYRDELEEWAAASAEAKAKLAAIDGEKGGAQAGEEKAEDVMGEGLSTGIGKVPTHVAVSMDDDGGGSETNWTLDQENDDLFGGIPVGIREFMRTEKMLKQRHAQDRSLGG